MVNGEYSISLIQAYPIRHHEIRTTTLPHKGFSTPPILYLPRVMILTKNAERVTYPIATTNARYPTMLKNI